MPYTVDLPLSPFPRFRWNVEQYENLFTMGLIAPGRYELIEGDIIEKMSQKEPHARVITLLFAVFSRLFGFDYLLTQFSVRLSENNLPEPDFAIMVRPARERSMESYPTATDVRLIIEVSDATLAGDLSTKARLYAQSGITEYWAVDIAGRRVVVHQTPSGESYTMVAEYGENETLSLTGANGVFIVSEILP